MNPLITPEVNSPKGSRMSLLAVLSLILTLAPIVVGYWLSLTRYPSVELVYFTGGTPLLGVILGAVAIQKIARSNGILRGSSLAVSSIVIGCMFSFFFFTSLPGYKRMKLRDNEAIVKMVARSLQASIEDYRAKHNGECPNSVTVVENILHDFVLKDEYFRGYIKNPKFIKEMSNPFNSRQRYTLKGGGLKDGFPGKNGEVGYIAPVDTGGSYRIISYMTDHGHRYTLIELNGEKPIE